jgi:hypothetical protein
MGKFETVFIVISTDDQIKLEWRLEPGYDPESALLTVYPLELKVTNFSQDVWKKMEGTGHKKVEVRF